MDEERKTPPTFAEQVADSLGIKDGATRSVGMANTAGRAWPSTRELIAATAKSMTKLAVEPYEVAAAPPQQQGATSGGVSLPSPGVVADRVGDLEDVDYDEMRVQINAVHQGPWFRVRAESWTGLDLACDSYAVRVDDSERIDLVAVLGCVDHVIAVIDVGCLPGHALSRMYDRIESQIDKQKQCNAEHRRHGRGCFC